MSMVGAAIGLAFVGGAIAAKSNKSPPTYDTIPELFDDQTRQQGVDILKDTWERFTDPMFMSPGYIDALLAESRIQNQRAASMAHGMANERATMMGHAPNSGMLAYAHDSLDRQKMASDNEALGKAIADLEKFGVNVNLQASSNLQNALFQDQANRISQNELLYNSLVNKAAAPSDAQAFFNTAIGTFGTLTGTGLGAFGNAGGSGARYAPTVAAPSYQGNTTFYGSSGYTPGSLYSSNTPVPYNPSTPANLGRPASSGFLYNVPYSPVPNS